ncbi:MAG: cytochrome C oxidase subunit II, partial [Deltaproteobacteria bacterium]|nr:cytochrome C oxidase subunit II [Deltaproteobacteria bacterium]
MHWRFPENISTFGGQIDSVFWITYYIVGAWFVAVELLLFYFILRFRKRPGQPAQYIKGDRWSELAWVMVPA